MQLLIIDIDQVSYLCNINGRDKFTISMVEGYINIYILNAYNNYITLDHIYRKLMHDTYILGMKTENTSGSRAILI